MLTLCHSSLHQTQSAAETDENFISFADMCSLKNDWINKQQMVVLDAKSADIQSS